MGNPMAYRDNNTKPALVSIAVLLLAAVGFYFYNEETSATDEGKK
jgi:hypothetical protein